ncbi:MAG: FMN-binding negative transcriptional regulator [Anaerolineae bacterium]|nr:FMN-binding negative transcriptional regulator [Anaerolineales bacterium]MCQ3979905.1 FMN-binding negative transcriptional regulator [Anaerolineae bacterium]
MYIPKAFAETDTEKLLDFIQANSFGILFSQHNDQPFATHLPFLLERSAEGPGWLWGHLAKANPHWHNLEGEVLVVFPGPHAYISPAWYEEKNVVPTWNYVAVHIYGHLSLTHEPAQLLKIVEDSVSFYEAPRPNRWSLDDSREHIQKLLKGIVGFKIEITRLEGKWKLSQNHPVARQEKVVKALRQRPDQNSLEIAGLMAENLVRRRGDE